MRRVRIGTRLAAAFAAVLALLVGVSVVAYAAIVDQRADRHGGAGAAGVDQRGQGDPLLRRQHERLAERASSPTSTGSGAARALGGDSVNYKAWQPRA